MAVALALGGVWVAASADSYRKGTVGVNPEAEAAMSGGLTLGVNPEAEAPMSEGLEVVGVEEGVDAVA